MSLKHLADNIAAHGRHGDDALVHVNKNELMALQALAQKHGKSLTTNPHTGMPEAFGLRQILPIAAGAVLASNGVDPTMAGLMVGGASTVASGNIRQGLSDGLGAYGGAGLSGGATAANPTNVVNTAPTAASTAGTVTGTTAPDLGYANMDPGAANLTPGQSTLATNTVAPNLGYANVDPGAASLTAGQNTLGTATNVAADTTAAGTEVAAKTPFQQVLANAQANPKYFAAAMAPALSDALQPKPYVPPTAKGGDADMGPRYQYSQGNVAGPNGQYSAPRYVPISNEAAKKLYGYADGGNVQQATNPQQDPNMQEVPAYDPVVRMAAGGQTKQQAAVMGAMNNGPVGASNAIARNAWSADPQSQAIAQYLNGQGGDDEQRMAGGGISALGAYSDGGHLLRGPGDGVSDSIPAQIGDKQPARLADGEFVVPARIVSELGNGSTDAGARKLYAMMDRVQRARAKTTGKNKIATNSRADKNLPA